MLKNKQIYKKNATARVIFVTVAENSTPFQPAKKSVVGSSYALSQNNIDTRKPQDNLPERRNKERRTLFMVGNFMTNIQFSTLVKSALRKGKQVQIFPTC